MKIPSVEDWNNNPSQALADSLLVAEATGAHGDPSTKAIALAIAGKALSAAAPIVGQAIGGPMGALAGAAVAEIASQMIESHKSSLSSLPPSQIALVEQAIATGANELNKKVN